MNKQNTSIGITRERKNGLRLETEKRGTLYDSITLDIILRDAGIPELSEEQLQQRLKKMEVTA